MEKNKTTFVHYIAFLIIITSISNTYDCFRGVKDPFTFIFRSSL